MMGEPLTDLGLAVSTRHRRVLSSTVAGMIFTLSIFIQITMGTLFYNIVSLVFYNILVDNAKKFKIELNE